MSGGWGIALAGRERAAHPPQGAPQNQVHARACFGERHLPRQLPSCPHPLGPRQERPSPSRPLQRQTTWAGRSFKDPASPTGRLVKSGSLGSARGVQPTVEAGMAQSEYPHPPSHYCLLGIVACKVDTMGQSPLTQPGCTVDVPTVFCPTVIEALGVLEPRESPVPWRDSSLSDLSLAGEEPIPGGSPSGSGSALSAHSTEALEGLSGRMSKASGRQDEASTPRRSLGARIQQLLTPSRRSPASRVTPVELTPDLPPPTWRSPMDSLLRPRERPGSTASEVAAGCRRGRCLGE